jgi:hypothetical protein
MARVFSFINHCDSLSSRVVGQAKDDNVRAVQELFALFFILALFGVNQEQLDSSRGCRRS